MAKIVEVALRDSGANVLLVNSTNLRGVQGMDNRSAPACSPLRSVHEH